MKYAIAAVVVALIIAATALPAASSAAPQHSSNIVWCRIAIARSVTLVQTKYAEERVSSQKEQLYLQEGVTDANEFDLLVTAIVAAGNGDSATVNVIVQQVKTLQAQVVALQAQSAALQAQDTALQARESVQIASSNAARARC